MKDEKDSNFLEDVISLLLFENNILRKKLNKIKLTNTEEIVDNFLVPPSLIIRELYKNINRKEKK